MQQCVDATIGLRKRPVPAPHRRNTMAPGDPGETDDQAPPPDGNARKRMKVCGYCQKRAGHNARSCPLKLQA
eukprot:4685799-Pleurochrysis_carterae.AAC.1